MRMIFFKQNQDPDGLFFDKKIVIGDLFDKYHKQKIH
jgi:predicted lipid carrier protein YhbT